MLLCGCPTPALPSLPTASLPLCGGSSIASLLLGPVTPGLLNGLCLPPSTGGALQTLPLLHCHSFACSCCVNAFHVECDRSKCDSSIHALGAMFFLSLRMTPFPPDTCCAPYKAALLSGWVCLKGSEAERLGHNRKRRTKEHCGVGMDAQQGVEVVHRWV